MVLIGFNPLWSFSILKDEMIEGKPVETIKRMEPYQIPDDFMGKIAISMGYEWEFTESMSDIENEIKKLQNYVDRLKKQREEQKRTKLIFPDFESFNTFSESIEHNEKKFFVFNNDAS